LELICWVLRIYLVVLVARAVLSWIPPQGGSLATLNRVLLDLTEPVLAPLRRIIPPAGMFDLSFIVAWVILLILQSVVCSAV
jgi:YggT family protein